MADSAVLDGLVDNLLKRMDSIFSDRNEDLVHQLSVSVKNDVATVMQDWLLRHKTTDEQNSAASWLPSSPISALSQAPPPPPGTEISTLGVIPNHVDELESYDQNCQVSTQGIVSQRLSTSEAGAGWQESGNSDRRSMQSFASQRLSTKKMSPDRSTPRLSGNGLQLEKRSRQSLGSLDSDAKAESLRIASLRGSLFHATEGDDQEEHLSRSSQESGELPPARVLCYRAFQKGVRSWQFELATASVIFCDLAVMGLKINHAANNLTSSVPPSFLVSQRTFAAVFAVELLVRIATECKHFFCKGQQSLESLCWNYFDILVVGGSLLEMSLEIADQADDAQQGAQGGVSSRTLRLLRILRLSRILRVATLLRFVSQLRKLVTCITSTLKYLLWSLVLLSIIIYSMAILFTDACTNYRIANVGTTADPSDHVQLAEYMFGDVALAALTLFGVISNGIDWVEVAKLLFDVSPLVGGIFCFYIVFCVFAVLNVMTGVFCQAAIVSADRDQDLMAEAILADRAHHQDTVRTLFESIDTDGDGKINFLELEDCFTNPTVKAVFSSLDIQFENAFQLFNLLDSEGEGEVNAMDFVDLCFRVKGPAKNIHIACLTKQSKEQNKKIRSKLAAMNEDMKHQTQMVHEIWSHVLAISEAETMRKDMHQETTAVKRCQY
eukprot:TRINITY_DN27676_c0_g1_i1.p1 TRINITY_DN27676_c0_g1~~TRINITY_DN27676_c0_g1_i1.p1  ORF type:complete len:666 (+),score=113.93 TRINITY_DN27676_c0_g1_i1:77-2074(+)